MENSSMQLRHKINTIKAEKFDARAKVKQSAQLQQTIRECGVQMVNHDIECQGSNLAQCKFFPFEIKKKFPIFW